MPDNWVVIWDPTSFKLTDQSKTIGLVGMRTVGSVYGTGP